MGLAFRSGCGRQVVEGGGRRCHGGSWRLPPGERGHCIQVCKRDRFATAKNRSRLPVTLNGQAARSEEHTSELQSLMRISYAVFCLNKKNISIVSMQTQTT